ncbi:hypothetical protein BC829DRAFT_465329 [Chytridium lagenaria]|nr:hypothetical protein BC829DRAFT_465329 [Chytridium lagenaria]
MSAARAFVAKHVKELLIDEGRRESMLMNLREGKPFVEEENMTVVTYRFILAEFKCFKAIIDVSGYSALASFLEQKLGKLSSEVMTSAVGDYMAKIAEVIYRYEGDIVKVGDALLVTFSSHSPSETADSTSVRALTCCLEVLNRYPTYKINLDEWSQILKVSKEACDSATTQSPIEANRPTTDYSSGSFKLSSPQDQPVKTKSLTLHIGVSRGMVGRVILGIPGKRLDYLVYGECLKRLGAMLDSTKSVTLRMTALRYCRKRIFPNLPVTPKLGYNIIGAPSLSRIDILSEVAAELLKNFVNRSILFKLNEVIALPKREAFIIPKTDTLKRGDDGRNSELKGKIDESMLWRTNAPSIKWEGQTVGIIRSEYRTVSVMFVKVHEEFDPDRAHMLFVKLLGQLDLFNGVFQQYSVDDKGQSMLACFGLPPFVNEKCGLIAVKAAARFACSLLSEDLSRVSISVTTGDILFGTVGWEYRKDAALLGDAVNVAARTRELVGDTFSATDLGSIQIKGKAHPLNVWAIKNFTPLTSLKADLSMSWTQNKTERQILSQSIRLWKQGRKPTSFFLVEGDSGMGKTTLLLYVQKLYKDLSILSCIARGSEVDQLNSFIAVRDVFTQILQFIFTSINDRQSSLTISTITTGRASVFENNLATLDKNDIEGILRDANENPDFASLLLAMVKGGESTIHQKDQDKITGRVSVAGKSKGDISAANDDIKRRALKFVLVRVISHLCAKYRIAVLLDDAQWIDDSSLEVFLYSLISILKPIRNVENGNFLHRLLASDFVYHLPLAGISLEDLSSALIYKQTNGNLLQTESLLRRLLEHTDEVVYVDENGQLCGRSIETLRKMISKSVEAVIMSQFDRLHSDYQHVLRCASILGQYVDLHELSLLQDNENLRPEGIRSLIAIHDQFEFLKPCGDAFDDSNTNAGVYYFRHISIMNAIYQSVAYAEREALHLRVAKHLDRVVQSNPSRKEQTLPTICYHYWRTRDAAKILERASELGLECVQKYLLMEARKSLQNVNDYLQENNAHFQASFKDEDRHLLEPLFQCRILANLAMTKFENLRDLPGALEAAINC